MPDHTRKFLDRIKEIAEGNTKSELREEIQEWKETYDVESRDELEETLTEVGDLSSEEIHERNRVIEYWEENLYYKCLIGHALHLYDDIEETMQISDVDVSTISTYADS